MTSIRIMGLALALSCALPVTAGCGAASPRTTLTYGDRAHRAYDSAMEVFEGGDMTEAADAFRRVRREFGLSRWAWLADLRLADVEFRQEHFTAAITAYRAWIRYHPTQPEVVFARYMIARSYYAQIPDEWALVPGSWERDQSSTSDAEDAFARYLEDFPRSEYSQGARDYLQRTRELLARAEINIAQYYAGRDRHEAAISRLREVVSTYHGSGLEPEALVRIGENFLDMNRRVDASLAFRAVLADFPRSSFADAARRYLSFIGPNPTQSVPAGESERPAGAATETAPTSAGGASPPAGGATSPGSTPAPSGAQGTGGS